MLEEFLQEVGKQNMSEYSSLLFNLYEDKTAFTIEAVYDEDALCIGRDHPIIICGKEVPWETVLKETGYELKKYYRLHKDIFSHLDTISYGFVDGEIFNIKKSPKKKEVVKFTKEDFYDFDSFRLEAWLSVYLTKEAKKKYQEERWHTDFKNLSEDQFKYWCEVLADNFDYSKY